MTDKKRSAGNWDLEFGGKRMDFNSFRLGMYAGMWLGSEIVEAGRPCGASVRDRVSRAVMDKMAGGLLADGYAIPHDILTTVLDEETSGVGG